MSKALKWTLVSAGTISALVPIILSFWKAVWVDPAVILVEMERIAEGYVPYKTMHLNYPPLWFFMMVGLKKLFGIPYGCYNFYLSVHYVFLLCCAGFVYGISREFGARKFASALAAWLTVIAAIWMNGDMVMFEVPTLFFGLGASYAALRFRSLGTANFLWIGILTACAFLVKQFGAGFFVLVLYLIIAMCDDRKIARALWCSLGFIIPIAVCVLIWGQDIINSLITNGYGGGELRAMCGDTSTALERILYAAVYFSTHVPFVFLPIVFVGSVVRRGHVRETLYCLFGIGGFLLSFIFLYSHSIHIDGGDLHYMLLPMPFAMIIAAMLLSYGNDARLCFLCTAAVISAFVAYSFYKILRFNVREDLSGEKAEQIEMGRKLADMVPDGKTVWIVVCDDEALYYFGNLIPADMKNFAYSVGGFEISADEAKSEVRQVDYVMTRTTFDVGYGWMHYYDSEVAEYVSRFPCVTVDEKRGVVLYDMSSERDEGE